MANAFKHVGQGFKVGQASSPDIMMTRGCMSIRNNYNDKRGRMSYHHLLILDCGFWNLDFKHYFFGRSIGGSTVSG